MHGEALTSRRQQALTLHHLLWDIFTTLFEPQLGLWIGNDCNPFTRLDTAPQTLVSRLMVKLDSFPAAPLEIQTAQTVGFPDFQMDGQAQAEQDAMIDQALISAVHAFSARWLPVDHFRRSDETTLQESIAMKECFVANVWSRAHRDVTAALTRPSYRSILALYLFGTTPTSFRNKDRHVTQHCLETSIRHYLQLRTRACISGRYPPAIPNEIYDTMQDVAARTRAQEEYNHLADAAYWFGIVIDGSRALNRCQPSILYSGSNGERQVWDPIRKQSEIANVFYRSMQSSKALLNDETVMTMIQYGSSCKTLFWKAVSRVQDYLFHQIIEEPFETLVENIVREMGLFETVFTPFLENCGRDFVLLSEKSRISYLILSFHFHLGVLILVDTLDGQPEEMNLDPSISIAGWRLSSTRAIVNLIVLMLQTESYLGDNTTSLILKDPYPEHTRNGLSRAAYSVLKLFRSMSLPKQIAEIMASSLFAGLETLSQISYTAVDSLSKLEKAYSETSLVVKRRQPGPSAFLTTSSTGLDSSVTPEIFQEETVRQLGLAAEDPSLVDKSIERHESHESYLELPQDFAWHELTGIDFASITQDWTFEDCFSSG